MGEVDLGVWLNRQWRLERSVNIHNHPPSVMAKLHRCGSAGTLIVSASYILPLLSWINWNVTYFIIISYIRIIKHWQNRKYRKKFLKIDSEIVNSQWSIHLFIQCTNSKTGFGEMSDFVDQFSVMSPVSRCIIWQRIDMVTVVVEVESAVLQCCLLCLWHLTCRH